MRGTLLALIALTGTSFAAVFALMLAPGGGFFSGRRPGYHYKNQMGPCAEHPPGAGFCT